MDTEGKLLAWKCFSNPFSSFVERLAFKGVLTDDKGPVYFSMICSHIKINKQISGLKRLLEGTLQSLHVLFVAMSDIYFREKGLCNLLVSLAQIYYIYIYIITCWKE